MPDRSEYQGYMDPDGNTLGIGGTARRGCRMAAGPSVRGSCRGRIAVGAPPAPATASRPAHLDGARAAAQSLQPFWRRRGTAGTARCGPRRGGVPGRGRDGSHAARAVPYRDSHAGACGRAGGGGRTVRRRMDAEHRRRVVRAGTPLRNRTVRVGRQRLSGRAGAACRREPMVARLLVAGAWHSAHHPAPTLFQLRQTSSAPPAKAAWCPARHSPGPPRRSIVNSWPQRSTAALPTRPGNAVGGADAALRRARPAGGTRSASPGGPPAERSTPSSRCCFLTRTTGPSHGPGRECGHCGTRWHVPRLPVAAGLRVAAGEPRPLARRHPGSRLGRAAGAAPDPAAGAATYTLVLQTGRAVHARLGRAAPGRERPGVVEVDAGWRIGVNETGQAPQRLVGVSSAVAAGLLQTKLGDGFKPGVT